MLHAMTVDVEDYYQVAAFKSVVKFDDWSNWPSRVEQNTRVLLDLFAENDIKCTFFVLGWVAERHPQLVAELVAGGHEVASHGYSHDLVYSQTPEVFKEETYKSKEILEAITQKPIAGYRAASYSITRASLWALDILAELGFSWDSSIFPIHHDRYGMPGTPEQPYTIKTRNGATLTELPLTTAKVLGQSVPAAGGGYFRQYPYVLSRWLFERASNGQTKPMIFYLHPWEIDPQQPRIPGAGLLSNFRHYTNLRHCLPRLQRLLQDFSFGSIEQSLAATTVDTTIDLNSFQEAAVKPA
ncbi:DUF3473 domain-containing protein [Exilibacterium tricleocarpae]|uniref:DUF3473 domain-containing protein n=2 Tax=Exilibacterium tricleocarpae TaxID=2591008 RepID=A0A545T3T8_9GAMM|nr:DUF3473 domain-containing protein [Exilibacterium tricleocarpae]